MCNVLIGGRASAAVVVVQLVFPATNVDHKEKTRKRSVLADMTRVSAGIYTNDSDAPDMTSPKRRKLMAAAEKDSRRTIGTNPALSSN